VEKCAENSQSNSNPSSEAVLNDEQLGRVTVLIDIVKRQLCSLEREMTWPVGAVGFSKIVINVVKDELENLKNVRNRHELRIVTQTLICKEILDRMEILLQNLLELGNLKQNHSIRIPFQRYIEVSFLKFNISTRFGRLHFILLMNNLHMSSQTSTYNIYVKSHGFCRIMSWKSSTPCCTSCSSEMKSRNLLTSS
jgi:hypothetical protein